VTHHGNEHVDEDDDGGDVIECKEKHSDRFHDARSVTATWKHVRIATFVHLAWVLDLNTVHSDH